MEQIADKITPEMLGNIESYTTAMVVNQWLGVIWKAVCIVLLIMIIGIPLYYLIKENY